MGYNFKNMETNPSQLASTNKIANSTNIHKKVWVKPEVEVINDDIQSGRNSSAREASVAPTFRINFMS